MSTWSPEWKKIFLRDIAEFRNGINYSSQNAGSGIKVVGVSNFQNYLYVPYNELSEINPLGVVREDDLLKDGDIVFVRSNGNRELIGRSLYVKSPPEPVTHSGFTIRLRFTLDRINHDFYAQVFRSAIIRDAISLLGSGTNISNLSQQILGDLEIPLPPLEEQRKIAAILSTWDEAIGLVEQLIAALGRRKQALMQLLLTGAVRFAGFEGEWEEVELQHQLSQMTDYVANGSFESLRLNVSVTEFPDYSLYVRLTDLRKGLQHPNQKYVTQKSYEFLSKSALYGQEILIANIGENVGEVILMPTVNMPATIAPNMIVMRANSETDSRFLYYYLSSPIGQQNISVTISGSGQPKLNKTELKKIRTSHPNLAEQKKIADVIETCDLEIETLKLTTSHMQEQKRGLMQQLLTGAVRV